MMKLHFYIFTLSLFLFTSLVQAKETKIIETGEADIEVRVFPAKGNVLLLGFACDEGKSKSEEHTAKALAEDGIEVWMPDVLSAMMLPNVKSSRAEISTQLLIEVIQEAKKTGKQIYLIASGSDTELILRGVNQWEKTEKKSLAGLVLLFPRLFKDSPEPGKKPAYVDAVGKSRSPIMLLEGERTPNRWGLNILKHELEKGGSKVIAKVIPKVRGYFFKRQDANRPEAIVTSQMAGLIKVSLYYLGEHND